MSLRNRLIALFVVFLLAVAGTAVAINVALGRVESNRLLVTGTLQPATVASRSMLVSLVDQETGERGFALTGDDTFLQPYRAGRSGFEHDLARLRSSFADDREMTRALARVQSAAVGWRTSVAEPEIAARRRGGVDAARQLVLSRQGKTAFDTLRDRVATVQSIIDARAASAQRDDASSLRALRGVINTSRICIALVLLAGALLVRRWVLQPVTALRARMRAVAAGSFDEQVLVDGPAEVVAIARDAESMRRRILAELEATRGATEALGQHSPVVAALRGELAASALADTGALEVSGMVQSAEGVLAGDWWETVPRPDGTTALVLADVSGHGPEAGLVAFAFKQRITALLGTGLEIGDAFAIAARASEQDDERFLSCLLVVVDPLHERLSWINAGHPPAVVTSRDDRWRVTELEPTGPLISSLTSGWDVREAPFQRRDLLVACTDGVLEARAADGGEFGHDRLLAVVRSLQVWSAAEVVAEVQQAVRRFAVDSRRDDVTCVALALT